MLRVDRDPTVVFAKEAVSCATFILLSADRGVVGHWERSSLLLLRIDLVNFWYIDVQVVGLRKLPLVAVQLRAVASLLLFVSLHGREHLL